MEGGIGDWNAESRKPNSTPGSIINPLPPFPLRSGCWPPCLLICLFVCSFVCLFASSLARSHVVRRTSHVARRTRRRDVGMRVGASRFAGGRFAGREGLLRLRLRLCGMGGGMPACPRPCLETGLDWTGGQGGRGGAGWDGDWGRGRA